VSDKLKFQQKYEVKDERLETARAYELKLQALGRTLISSMYMLVRNVKLHSPDNTIFIKPLEQLKDCMNTIIAMDQSLNLQGAGESFYLNNMLIKTEIGSIDNVRYLLQEFERRNVGGFVLEKDITIPELKNFVFIFSRESAEEVGSGGVSSRRLNALKLRRFEKLQEILQGQEGESAKQDQQVDRKRYTVTIYARTIYFMRKYLTGLRGDGPQVPLGKAGRYIQDLVDTCHGHRSHFLGLSTLKSDDEYLCFHSVNVALLSVVFGVELGLDKSQLRDLGMAALFHDIGKIDVADEVWEKKGKLEPAEARQVNKAPIFSVKKIIRSRQLNKSTLHRIIAAYEHKADFGTPVKDLRGNVSFVVPNSSLGIYSKIIAIVDCYDALTSRRPFRDAFGPDVALTLMFSELKHKFDADLLRIFMSVMKMPSVRVFSDRGEKVVIF
jgi:HD-GYP domain-containing protein (c-di-GMP phosphodiesterase class II)